MSEALSGRRGRHARAIGIRAGEFSGNGGAGSGNVQQLVILPKVLAHDFLRFAQANPKPCPVLAIAEAGDPRMPNWGRISISAAICRVIGCGGAANSSQSRPSSLMSGATISSALPSVARFRSSRRSSMTGSNCAT